MKGIVFSIEEFSIYDGPGIRTTVFLKGCPLSCSWCHNPEGQNPMPEIVRSPNGCLNCGACIKYGRKKGEKILFTQQSINSCPVGLLRVCGEEMTSDELAEILLKNKRLLIDGGITFSGGEPTYQFDFLTTCLRSLKGKLSTAVQTCGFTSKKHFKTLMDLTDYFLFDVKLIDEELHKKYVGASNKVILQNLSMLAASGKKFVVRTPLIPQITDTSENIEAIADTLISNNIKYIELLPYNKIAGGKYKMVGRNYCPCFDEKIEPNPHLEIFDAYGITSTVL